MFEAAELGRKVSKATYNKKDPELRTALLKDDTAYVQAGGGWVADSVPEAEFMETVNKAKAMVKAVALAEALKRQAD